MVEEHRKGSELIFQDEELEKICRQLNIEFSYEDYEYDEELEENRLYSV